MATVSLVRCSGYDTREVSSAVERSVDLVGGIAAYVSAGQTVLLKPNLLSARRPDEAVDTHPEVVRAVVRMVKSRQARVIIGDSPGGYGENIQEVFERSGMKRIALEEGVELVAFAEARYVDGIPLSRHLLDADCVISIPKLKTHVLTVFTAGIKNMFGAVPGIAKTQLHAKAPKEEDFAKTIAKVYALAKPCLTIVDGIVAMEGDGPSGGRARELNVVIAGADAVAVDACIATMIGLDPLNVCVIREAVRLGAGEADMARITIEGEHLTNCVVKDFKLPHTTLLKMIPRRMAAALASFVRFTPVIERSACRGCNLCKVSCPVGAIVSEDTRCAIDKGVCVQCLCCVEICPYRAVSIRRSMLARLIWR